MSGIYHNIFEDVKHSVMLSPKSSVNTRLTYRISFVNGLNSQKEGLKAQSVLNSWKYDTSAMHTGMTFTESGKMCPVTFLVVIHGFSSGDAENQQRSFLDGYGTAFCGGPCAEGNISFAYSYRQSALLSIFPWQLRQPISINLTERIHRPCLCHSLTRVVHIGHCVANPSVLLSQMLNIMQSRHYLC